MQINAELLKRDWVDLMIKRSKEYLNNPSEENSKFLKEAFNSEKSFRAPPHNISQYESLSMIPAGDTRNLIGVALGITGSGKAAGVLPKEEIDDGSHTAALEPSV